MSIISPQKRAVCLDYDPFPSKIWPERRDVGLAAPRCELEMLQVSAPVHHGAQVHHAAPAAPQQRQQEQREQEVGPRGRLVFQQFPSFSMVFPWFSHGSSPDFHGFSSISPPFLIGFHGFPIIFSSPRQEVALVEHVDFVAAQLPLGRLRR